MAYWARNLHDTRYTWITYDCKREVNLETLRETCEYEPRVSFRTKLLHRQQARPAKFLLKQSIDDLREILTKDPERYR
jgi:hypothetical protein